MKKNLEQLLLLIPDASITGERNKIIKAVTHDSRNVVPGTLFICLTGNKVDGHEYIQQAVELGAVAVLVEKQIAVPAGIIVIQVENTRTAMQLIVPAFFDYPARELRMIGVTGTNGKTTTTYLVRSILKAAGFKTGVIGTIQTLIEDRVLPVKNTTPDVVELQRTLAEMVDADIDYVIMEVSSHALALDRVAGCEFDIGAFTNITQDHLDFHGTFDRYTDAKAKLFRLLGQEGNIKQGKAAVINLDDGAGKVMLENTSCRAITYSIHTSADIMAKDIEVFATGSSFCVTYWQGEIPLKLKITGVFNVYNVMAAVGVALAEGIESTVIQKALEQFESVPGRFELVDAGQSFTVIVDYAHTPDGLENILKTAKQFAKQRIIAVFGCGGDRDRTKRPIMGKIAAEMADVVIATSDNPRSEDPDVILTEIEAGIKEGLTPNKQYEKIVDRRQAIVRALSIAQAEDVVIIAGKGHETYQILKDRTISFDDKQIAIEILEEMK